MITPTFQGDGRDGLLCSFETRHFCFYTPHYEHLYSIRFSSCLSSVFPDQSEKRLSFNSQGTVAKSTSLNSVLKLEPGASLVAQWLRICLPMQGTRVQALVWEDPTCLRATKPVSHNY